MISYSLLDSNLSHVSVRILRVPDVNAVSKSFSGDDCQIESHSTTMKNMSLTSTVTVTNSPPKHYHCAWTLYITECIVLGAFQTTSWKCHRWNAESQNIKLQKQTVKGRNTWFLWKAFVSKKAKNFIFILSPSEKDENDNTQWIDYQRLQTDNIFSIGIPPIPDFLLSLFHS